MISSADVAKFTRNAGSVDPSIAQLARLGIELLGTSDSCCTI